MDHTIVAIMKMLVSLFQTHGSSNGDFNHHSLLSKKTQGSSNGGVVDAIQLELPVDLINSTEYRCNGNKLMTI